MNLTNIKARLLRYSEMSLSALTDFKAWMKRASNFDPAILTSPSVRIAVATNEHNEPLAMCAIETVLVTRGFVVSPTATATEAQQAGNTIDAVVANEAHRAGVSKWFIVVPDHLPKLKEEKCLRVVERQIARPVAMGVGYESTPALNFVN